MEQGERLQCFAQREEASLRSGTVSSRGPQNEAFNQSVPRASKAKKKMSL